MLPILFSSSVNNYLAEKAFLDFHKRDIAVNIIDIGLNKNYYSHYLLGRLYFVKGDLQQSIENFSRSIELNPMHKESYYGRGLAYGFTSIQDLKKAELDFIKYIELNDIEFKETNNNAYGLWAAYNDLAWVYFLKSDFINAEKVAKQGLEISKENPWLLNMLSVALIEQNRCEEAYPVLQKARNLANTINEEEFGEAYSGDNKQWWTKGLVAMKKTIEENIQLCLKQL